MSSYGGLIPGQSEEDFFSCDSMPCNRELMRVFKDGGLVEQLGSDMSRILRVYDRNIFDISDHFIKVVFAFDEVQNFCPVGQKNRTENEQILDYIRENPSITIRELCEKMDCTASKIKRLYKNSKKMERLSA